MPSSASSTVNLGLPAVPEVVDPKLFPEFVRIYNAIKLIAESLDTYTGSGTVVTHIESSDASGDVVLEDTKRTLTQIKSDLDELVSSHAQVAELRKSYLRYTVPIFTVVGKFGCNGKTPQAAYVITKAPAAAPAGGVGTAAGAWDTAAHRDAAIAAIQANANAITEIQTILKNIGLGA